MCIAIEVLEFAVDYDFKWEISFGCDRLIFCRKICLGDVGVEKMRLFRYNSDVIYVYF